MMKIIILTMLTLSLNTLAAFDADELKGIALVQEDIDAFSKTLSRPIMAYHWNNMPDVRSTLKTNISSEDVTLKSLPVINFLNNWRESFFLNQRTNGDVGWGLYLSTTPTASIAWRCESWLDSSRCTDWLMAEMKFPAGAKFLDLRIGSGIHRRTIKLSSKTSRFLNETLLCQLPYEQGTVKLKGNVYNSYQKHELSESSCFKYIKEAIKRSQIAFLTYGWFDNEQMPNCDMTQSKVGIIAVNTEVTSENTTVFSSKTKILPAEISEYSILKGSLVQLGESKVSNAINVDVKGVVKLPEYFNCRQDAKRSEDLAF